MSATSGVCEKILSRSGASRDPKPVMVPWPSGLCAYGAVRRFCSMPPNGHGGTILGRRAGAAWRTAGRRSLRGWDLSAEFFSTGPAPAGSRVCPRSVSFGGTASWRSVNGAAGAFWKGRVGRAAPGAICRRALRRSHRLKPKGRGQTLLRQALGAIGRKKTRGFRSGSRRWEDSPN